MLRTCPQALKTYISQRLRHSKIMEATSDIAKDAPVHTYVETAVFDFTARKAAAVQAAGLVGRLTGVDPIDDDQYQKSEHTLCPTNA